MGLQQKYESIAQDYLSGVTVKDIAIKYGYKNVTAIFPILKKQGIETKSKKWTNDKINILIDKYSYENWDVLLSLLEPFTKDEITHKAYKLNIKRDNYHYTIDEINILINNYNNMTVKELQDIYFPNRSKESIMVKANKLGLESRIKWDEDEILLFIELYSKYNNDYLHKYFPNRTDSALMSMANILGMKKEYSKKEYSEEFLISKLKDLSFKLKRSPFYYEINEDNNMPSIMTYYRYFGGLRNAYIESGLELNACLFGKFFNIYYSDNNDICFSKAELVITNYLIKYNINYQKEYYYRDIINDKRCGLKRMDWLINNNIIVEYFGLAEKHYYKVKMEEKINICSDNNIPMISIYKNNILKLDNIFKFLK